MSEVAELLGKTLVKIIGTDGDNEILFVCSDGSKYRMHHYQDCCESVTIEDVCGEFDDLIGNPLLMAEEATSDENPKDYDDSFTWTFYKFATVRGYVTIRWYGSSNGYYSESVDFEKVDFEEETNWLTSSRKNQQ